MAARTLHRKAGSSEVQVRAPARALAQPSEYVPPPHAPVPPRRRIPEGEEELYISMEVELHLVNLPKSEVLTYLMDLVRKVNEAPPSEHSHQVTLPANQGFCWFTVEE